MVGLARSGACSASSIMAATTSPTSAVPRRSVGVVTRISRDGILTLPAALAIRDPRAAALFENGTVGHLRRKFAASLPDAEAYLDGVAAEAVREARGNARSPKILVRLVELTRRLSR